MQKYVFCKGLKVSLKTIPGVLFQLSIFGRKPNSNFFHFLSKDIYFSNMKHPAVFFINKSGVQIQFWALLRQKVDLVNKNQ